MNIMKRLDNINLQQIVSKCLLLRFLFLGKANRIFAGFFIASVLFLVESCNEPNDFPDYDYTAVYFPLQFPVRTLSLADNDYFDNSLDKELKFNIAPNLGGVYINKTGYTVDFVIDETLAQNIVTDQGDTIFPLPKKYYALSPHEQVVIPKGSKRGMIDVQLTDEFLDDILAVGRHYVIPLRITATSADSVLTGVPLSPESDKRVANDWVSPPKDFTLFCIRYVNNFHGKYLHRGRIDKLDANGEVESSTVFREHYVEKDQIVELNTAGRNTVVINGYANVSTNKAQLKLVFDSNNNCVVSYANNADITANGTGKFIPEGDMWGNKKRDAIHLEYRYTLNSVNYMVYDTLVFRDRNIQFEEFIPVVIK
jgi:hypothetical protein